MEKGCLLFCLVAAVWAAAAGETVSSIQSSVVSPIRARLPEDARLLAAQSRKTITTITTSTTTAPVFCLTAISDQACGKRRRRMHTLTKDIGVFNGRSKDLESSLDDTPSKEPADEKARLSYTVWWTQTSTLTHISTVNSGITVSVSYFCSIVGASYPAMCR